MKGSLSGWTEPDRDYIGTMLGCGSKDFEREFELSPSQTITIDHTLSIDESNCVLISSQRGGRVKPLNKSRFPIFFQQLVVDTPVSAVNNSLKHPIWL